MKRKVAKSADNFILLSPGDVQRLQRVKDLLDQATKEKKRTGQAIALLEAQRELMGTITWFLMRDIM
jgi:hypothetical protein